MAPLCVCFAHGCGAEGRVLECVAAGCEHGLLGADVGGGGVEVVVWEVGCGRVCGQ